MRGVIAAICLTLAPVVALAEGGVLRLNCAVLGSCFDDAGSVSACGGMSLAFAPVNVAADGTGAYVVTSDAGEWPAARLRTEGPFVWSTAPGQVTALLLAEGQTIFALHSYNDKAEVGADGPAEAVTIYLDCEVT